MVTVVVLVVESTSMMEPGAINLQFATILQGKGATPMHTKKIKGIIWLEVGERLFPIKSVRIPPLAYNNVL